MIDWNWDSIVSSLSNQETIKFQLTNHPIWFAFVVIVLTELKKQMK